MRRQVADNKLATSKFSKSSRCRRNLPTTKHLTTNTLLFNYQKNQVMAQKRPSMNKKEPKSLLSVKATSPSTW